MRATEDRTHKVIGTVASVAGNTINVTVTDANGNPAQTAVTVTDTTHYSKGAADFAGHRARQVHHRKRNQGWWRDAAGDGCHLGPRHDGQCPQPAAHKKRHPH